MPELPEVEVVRAGLAPAATGARVMGVDVRDARALKRHIPIGAERRTGHGTTLDPQTASERAADFERRMTGARLQSPERRGKFMWIPMRVDACHPGSDSLTRAQPELALLAHLGMSGQLLLRNHDAADDRHVRIRMWIEHPVHGELRIDFVDQRLFSSLAIDQLAPVDGSVIPLQAHHVARDPLDPAFNDVAYVAALGRRSTAIKNALLDQRLMSGVGNIYADEALWRARVHPETPAARLSARKVRELLQQLREVFARALAEGGTSFDAQYVNVNGESGYFAHSLNAYGRGGEPCYRCGTAVRRVPFAGRSSHYCPRCQRRR